jgi:hypothetical protein
MVIVTFRGDFDTGDLSDRVPLGDPRPGQGWREQLWRHSTTAIAPALVPRRCGGGGQPHERTLPNALRDFNPNAPDELWCADITYLGTWEGLLYLAGVLDGFSRRVVGWSMRDDLRGRRAALAGPAAPPPCARWAYEATSGPPGGPTGRAPAQSGPPCGGAGADVLGARPKAAQGRKTRVHPTELRADVLPPRPDQADLPQQHRR